MQPHDETSIRALVEAQFDALSWQRGNHPDHDRFLAGFLPGATLFPAARPVASVSAPDFLARMERVREAGLHRLQERLTSLRVMTAGAVAVALAGCEMVENGQIITHDVSAFLLIKNAGAWRIAAQGWDAVVDVVSSVGTNRERAQPVS